MNVGDTRELVLTEDLTRTQLVQYAGASGDYNPLHSDERFAVEVAGYPSLFAHGMLTMGMTGRVLTGWFGVEAPYDTSASTPNQSVSTRPVMPIVSMPWANNDG